MLDQVSSLAAQVGPEWGVALMGAFAGLLTAFEKGWVKSFVRRLLWAVKSDQARRRGRQGKKNQAKAKVKAKAKA